MCAVWATVLAIELAITAAFMFLSSHCGISKLVFFEIVAVVVVLPLFLFDALVSFDGFTFKDELGLRSESGDVPIKVELLPPS
jgi:purine-cytosine permease-like protein